MQHYLFVGDLSLDLSLSAPHIPAPDEKVHCTASVEGVGGVITNTAVAFVKAGGTATLVVQPGDDAASSAALGQLSLPNLTLEAEAVAGGLCRVVTILEPHGEKRLLLYPGVSIYPDLQAIQSVRLDGSNHVHTACFHPAAKELVSRAREAGIPWSLDLEPATFVDGIEASADVLAGASLVFLNDRAAATIGPEAIGRLFDMGVKMIVRSRGPDGAELHDHASGAMIAARPPQGLQIVDTTGAGDCLAGWFLAGMAAGWPIELVLGRAVHAATLSCTVAGAQNGYPQLQDILNSTNKTEKTA